MARGLCAVGIALTIQGGFVLGFLPRGCMVSSLSRCRASEVLVLQSSQMCGVRCAVCGAGVCLPLAGRRRPGWASAAGTIIARKLGTQISWVLCPALQEAVAWPRGGTVARRDAHPGRLSPNPRFGALSGPPSRSQRSRVAMFGCLADCRRRCLRLAGSREMTRCAATPTCADAQPSTDNDVW